MFSFLSSSAQKHSPESYDKRMLNFGSGGGFTGEIKMYTLLEDGELFFRSSVEGPYEFLRKVPKRVVKKAFIALDSMNIATRNINYPGNIYQFIEIQSGAEKQKATWGDTQYAVEPELKEIYQKLNEYTEQKRK